MVIAKLIGSRFRVKGSGFRTAAGLKSGQFNQKRNFALGWFHMTG
jgi:hypothetical protein